MCISQQVMRMGQFVRRINVSCPSNVLGPKFLDGARLYLLVVRARACGLPSRQLDGTASWPSSLPLDGLAKRRHISQLLLAANVDLVGRGVALAIPAIGIG